MIMFAMPIHMFRMPSSFVIIMGCAAFAPRPHGGSAFVALAGMPTGGGTGMWVQTPLH